MNIKFNQQLGAVFLSAFVLFYSPSSFTAPLIIDTNVTATGTVDVNDDFFITSSGVFDLNAFTLNLTGDWSNLGTFIHNFGTVDLDGAFGIQTITSGSGAFFNLIASGASTVQLQNTLVVNGTLTNTNGIFNTNNQNVFTNAMTVSGGTFGLPGDGGNWLVSNDVNVSGTGTINATNGSWDIGGNMNLASGNLNAQSGNINVAGNWNNTGTIFNAGTSTVTLNGAGTQVINTGGDAFNHLISSGSGLVQVSEDLTVSGTLTNTNGTFDTTTKTVNANMLMVSGGLLTGSGDWNVGNDVDVSNGSLSSTGNWSIGNDVNISNGSLSSTGNWSIGNDVNISGGALSSSGNWNIGNGINISGGSMTSDGLWNIVNNVNVSGTGMINASTGTWNINGLIAILSGTFDTQSASINASAFNVTGGTLGSNTSTGDWAVSNDVNVSGTGTINATNGSWDVNGNMNLASGNLNAQSGNINVAGNWNNTGTVFNAGTGTVTLNGAGTQIINTRGDAFNNLTASGSGSVQLQNTLVVNGTLTNTNGIFNTNNQTVFTNAMTVSGGTFGLMGDGGNWLVSNDVNVSGTGTMNTTNGSLDVGGDMNLASGNLNVQSGNINVAGNWNNTGTVFNAGTGTVTLNGAGTQVINTGGDAFNNLTGSGSGSVQLQNALAVNGTLTNTNGTFNANTQTINTNMLMVSGGLLTGSGAWNISNDVNVSGGVLTNNGILNIAKNVNLSGSGSLNTTNGIWDIGGNMNLASGNLNAQSGNINVAGNWNNTGTIFNAGTGTVTLNGAGTQIINTRGDAFNNLTASGSGSVQLQNTLVVNGTLTNTNGIFNTNNQTVFTNAMTVSGGTFGLMGDGGNWLVSNDVNVSGTGTMNTTNGSLDVGGDMNLASGNLNVQSGNINVAGNWNNTGTVFNAGTGTVTLNGAGTQVINTGGDAFNNLMASGSSTVLLANSLNVNGMLTNSSGNFNTNGQALNTGSLVINGGNFNNTSSGGILNVIGDLNLNGGILNATDVVNVGGNFIQTNGTLGFGFSGVGIGDFDVVNVASIGSFTGGNIEFNFINGYNGSINDSWDFLFASSFIGWDSLTFSAVGLSAGLDYEIFELSDRRSLRIVSAETSSVPEPSSLIIFILGLMGLRLIHFNNQSQLSFKGTPHAAVTLA